MTFRADVSLNDALADYYTVKQGRFSSSTWKGHLGRLEDWRKWVVRETHPQVRLSDITNPEDRYMERYFNRLRGAYKPRSFNNYRQYLVSFWKYCAARGWINTNPMLHVDPMRVPRYIRLQLSAGEMLRLLEGAKPRDRIALAIGMNTGLRSTDIMTLKVGAANLENNTLLAWIEKIDEEMTLPVTAELRLEFIRWFKHYASVMNVEDWRLLPSDWTMCPPAHYHGNNVRRPELGGYSLYKVRAVYSNPEQIVQRGLTRIGLPAKWEGFHTLRRSTGRVLYELAAQDGVGDPIRIPQSLLGHKNRETTEIYLGVTHEQKLRDQMLGGKSFLGRALQLNQAASEEEDESQNRKREVG